MSEWISVEEELPREMVDLVLVGRNKEVIGCMPARYIDGEFLAFDGFHTIANKLVYQSPTHWMPLSEPPQ